MTVCEYSSLGRNRPVLVSLLSNLTFVVLVLIIFALQKVALLHPWIRGITIPAPLVFGGLKHAVNLVEKTFKSKSSLTRIGRTIEST